MPFTPFHFGPGLLLKAAAPRALSLTAFVAANVAIDVESLVNLLAGRYPVHATLHTLPGATAVGLLAGLAVAGTGRLVRKAPKAELALRPALWGGVLGGVSHALLDGIMHADARPFLPLTYANPLRRLVPPGQRPGYPPGHPLGQGPGPPAAPAASRWRMRRLARRPTFNVQSALRRRSP